MGEVCLNNELFFNEFRKHELNENTIVIEFEDEFSKLLLIDVIFVDIPYDIFKTPGIDQ